jgi:excisionase family DNA binding protein|tara:strand:- start:760 stop:1140 length:381 start_codon:yes stop_codon:yes gene_type:complete
MGDDIGGKLSLTEAAELLEVPKPTISRHRKQGKFSAEKIGNAYYVEPSELARAYPDKWASSQRDKSEPHQMMSDDTAEKDKEIAHLQALLEAKDENLKDLRDQLRSVNARLEDHTKKGGWFSRLFG